VAYVNEIGKLRLRDAKKPRAALSFKTCRQRLAVLVNESGSSDKRFCSDAACIVAPVFFHQQSLWQMDSYKKFVVVFVN
jgi:hypothetical protein